MFSPLQSVFHRPAGHGVASRPRPRRQLWLELLEDRTAPATAVYASADVPVAILDLQTVSSTITINESFRLADLDVVLDIDHTYDSDLDVTLVAPDGTRVELFTGVGEDGQGFHGTRLDDEAAFAIESASAPLAGTFRPSGSLADLDGKDVHVTWTLEITDTAEPDNGTLNGWSLIVTTNT